MTFTYFDGSEWPSEKSRRFQGCAKKMLRLHTVRIGIPETHQTRLSASSFHEYHSDTPIHPPNTLQTSPGNSRYQQTTTDDNRHLQTPSDTDRCCLSMSGGVCWRMLSFVDILSSLEMSGGCLGDVWVVSGGIWVVFMETWGIQTSFRSICDSSPYSM